MLVDAGVNHVFTPNAKLIDAKVALGTQNFSTQPAMSLAKCHAAMDKGAAIMDDMITKGCNTIGFGEMGIGNTSSASCLMSIICALPIDNCTGKGTGISNDMLNNKVKTLSDALDFHSLSKQNDIFQILATFGGFEIAMMVGAMLKAAEEKCVLLIDGFIVSSALLVASTIAPNILDYCIFSHCSEESAHASLLEHFNATPLLKLNMRLGEGTGAALAFPLVQSAVNFLNEMASFESANVSTKQ